MLVQKRSLCYNICQGPFRMAARRAGLAQNFGLAPGQTGKKRYAVMNIGNALKILCVGSASGIVLRVVQMLYFYDYTTGFYTDGGLVAACSLGIPLLAALLAAVACFKSRRYFGPYTPRRNILVGGAAVFSGLVLVVSGSLQIADYLGYLQTGFSSYNSSSQMPIHLAFMVASLLFGLLQLYMSVGFFTGRRNLENAPLLYLFAVLWGISNLILSYVFYARSSSFVENFFSVVGSAALLLCLFYLCKLFAGVDEEGAAKRAFVSGGLAVVLTVTYCFSNLVLLLLGRSYTGEIPAMFQLSSLGIALFVLTFLITFRKYSLRRTPSESPAHEERKFKLD